LIIDKGIIDIYDYLSLDVACGNGYIDIEVTIEKNGLVIDNTRIDINNAILYNAVMRLRENAHQRGEYWISFVMSYSQGEQVKIQFRYNES
jgi:ubiquinone/menaquinone biosynthesis C-methylase UbiE